MSSTPRITLEQWRSLLAVVDCGGYAQAAQRLHKSRSAVTYAVQKLESALAVKAFEIRGRKAVLTPTGQLLYWRARALLDEAGALERTARMLSAGWEAEIGLAVEQLFPTWLLLDCLSRFGEESPHTRVELIESVLSGSPEALLDGRADIAVSAQVPPGFLGDPLMRLRAIAVAHPDHPLHRLGRELHYRDLRAHRHLLVRETGARRDTRATPMEAVQRWTVSQMTTSIRAVRMGYGFAWLPQEHIREELSAGTLKPLPLREGGERFVDLYLILADRDFAGPGVLRLAELLRERVASECPAQASCTGASAPDAAEAATETR